MHDEITDRIEVVGLGKHLVLLAVDFDLGDGCQEAAAVDLHGNFLVGKRDGEGSLLVTIDDCRNFTVAPNCPGGPLTDPFARLGREHV
jgi:hypothetical protein